MNYQEAGVDIDKGEAFVSRIKSLVGESGLQNDQSKIGSFAAVYPIDEDRYLTASTDGVGTKLLLAMETGIYDSIGIDLVAMCVNDLICNGSRPLFFLDYFATGKLDLGISEEIIKGIIEGCKQSSCLLIGGETAEMPGVYQEGHFDLAGFSVGELYKKDMIDGTKLCEGDSLVAVESSGFHSNGYSLVRKLLKSGEKELKKDLLRPTRIYVKEVLQILNTDKSLIRGIANITGGGIKNIDRINANFEANLTNLPPIEGLPKEVFEIIKRSKLTEKQLYTTFNMGLGMVFATNRPEELIERFSCLNLRAFKIGNLRAKS